MLLRLLFGVMLFVATCSAVSAQQLFFEPPRNVETDNARFPESHAGDEFAVVVYQEIVPAGENRGEIYLGLRRTEDGRNWDTVHRFAGPIEYSRESAPMVFSARIDDRDHLYVAVAKDATETRILRSTDYGRSFEDVGGVESDTTIVSPRLFKTEDGGLLLFVSQNIGLIQSILYSTSPDGSDWSSLESLVDRRELGLNFLPAHASLNGREHVVFQSVDPRERTTYQLYHKYSEDGGQTWSDVRRLSEFYNPNEADDSYSYDNQRPVLERINDRLALAWERRLAGGAPQIYYVELGRDGEFISEPDAVTTRLEVANYPRVLVENDTVYVLWFDNPRGSSNVFLSQRVGQTWSEQSLSLMTGASRFATPMRFRDRIHVFWHNWATQTRTALTYLEPDQSVAPPRVTPVNFADGGRSRRDEVEVAWQPPPDPSGIEAFNYVWSRDPNAEVPLEPRLDAGARRTRLEADEDGRWYFRIVTKDRAGNWSAPSTVVYERDRTPPDPVVFVPPPVDEQGYLQSNTFTLEWEPPDDDHLDGYSVSLTRLGGPELDIEPEAFGVPSPSGTVMTRSPRIARRNIDDGIYALAVAPIDDVGNVGEPQTLVFRTNKYIPTTEIWNISSSRDMLGRYSLEILGRGFTAEGEVEEIVLDREGEEPFDYVFSLADGAFSLDGDQRISDILIDRVRTGEYRIGLRHSERGLQFADRALAFEESGHISFGNYTVRYEPRFVGAPRGGFSLAAADVMLGGAALLLALVVAFSGSRVAGLVAESRLLEMEVKALLAGAPLPSQKKVERIKAMKRRGVGLRVKFAFFVVLLVVAVVVLVAFFLGSTALERQENTLARGLEQRVEVLLESLVTQSAQLLDNPEDNLIELSQLTRQTGVMDEVLYLTVTGRGREGTSFDYIWATNDPALEAIGTAEYDEAAAGREILPSIDTGELQPFGQSRLEDPASEAIPELEEEINRRAREELGDIPQQIDDFTDRISELVLMGTPEAEAELAEIDEIRTELESRVGEVLGEVGRGIQSYPEFDAGELGRDTTEYLFYKPVLFRMVGETPQEARYYRGMVRLGVSTELILHEIDETTQDLIMSTVVVAVGALIAGIIGATILATIVVIPINRLMRGVEVIRDTEDKEKLADHLINVRTRDELKLLADTVNSMTQGLVKAAQANKDLTVGKEVQKMFIPLDLTGAGQKMTTGYEDLPTVEFFGYYEGAKGVSGDYFDYRKLDDVHYALIKCDVAGKGVPAALIMVEVATIFLDYFTNWTLKTHGLRLSKLVYRINDLLEERGFKGRFTAFTVALYNSSTGKLILSNAGDNQLHIYKGARRRVVQMSMPETPAAGVFPSSMAPQGFPEISLTLEHGDMALFFTDGVEEAKRSFRDSEYQPMSDKDGVGDEELSLKRIHDIVAAVQAGDRYTLERVHSPDPDEVLTFNFGSCEPTASNATLALMAVEKIFRLYRAPEAGAEQRIAVDKKIDDFLKVHFEQYNLFFGHPRQGTPEDSLYNEYTHLVEDEQYDDLTMLALRRK